MALNQLILLVEDNPDDVELTMRALKKNRIATEVVVVRHGVEALDFLFGSGAYAGRNADILPDLVLLDLKLPKVDGLEVLRRLRGDARTRFLPVVVLTLSNEEQDIVEAYRLGVNSYVRKPVDFDRFNELLQNLGRYWLEFNETPSRRRSTPAGV
ncbi:MAG: response regulator [Candidatus Binatia bacterium]